MNNILDETHRLLRKETTLESKLENQYGKISLEPELSIVDNISHKELLDELYQKQIGKTKENIVKTNTEKNSLTAEEFSFIKKETDWSDEIIRHIENMEQYSIYKKAGLHEAEINGKKCLIKDIDLDYIDSKTGLTNRELMERGRSPIDAKTGERIELHHMGQEYDAPFAELTENSEHGDGNHSLLHPNKTDSWRNNPEHEYKYNNLDKPGHWKARVNEV